MEIKTQLKTLDNSIRRKILNWRKTPEENFPLANIPTIPEIGKPTPMKRNAKAQEAAKTMCCLPADEAEIIMGQNTRVDGGMTGRL